MDLAAALQALYARGSRGVRLGLEPMAAACARAGNPERAFECVHVAGTNGKGSTSAWAECMLRASGRRTALYTSPHLCRFAERVQVDGDAVADTLLAECIAKALHAGPDLSFFETATLAAFLAFRSAGVEVAVLEVGLGGRLDATNVVPHPRVCGITRIAWDHADLLGDTLEAIAAEKAGIAKPGVPVWVGPVAPSVYASIARVAHERRAVVYRVEDAPADGVFDDAVRNGLPLGGSHQVHNARLACVLARAAGASDAGIARGLREVRWPGRLERITVGSVDGVPVDVILDAAHNVDGVEAVVSSLEGARKDVGSTARPADTAAIRSPVLVFGAMADKPYAEMLRRLASVCPVRHYAAPEGRKPADLAELCAIAPGTAHLSVDAALQAAIYSARGDGEAPNSNGATGGMVLVTGSIYLVGAVRARLLGLPRDPPIAL